MEPLNRYRSLIQEWNPTAKLMSKKDAAQGIDAHVADSWTLLPYCFADYPLRLLDVGSGGGFPGVPLAIAVPNLLVTLLDRSERKTAFLRRVALQLALGNVTVVTGTFPDYVDAEHYDLITARAVETPAVLRKGFESHVIAGATFLCQSEDAVPESPSVTAELVEDAFTAEGYRRSRLWVVTATTENA